MEATVNSNLSFLVAEIFVFLNYSKIVLLRQENIRIMLAVLLLVKGQKLCSIPQIMPKIMLAQSARAYPRKALGSRPQPTTSVPVNKEKPWERGWRHCVKMPTSALCTCISFSLVLYFFKALNSNFVFECPTNAIFKRVSKTVAQIKGDSAY